jgi:cell division protein ZapA
MSDARPARTVTLDVTILGREFKIACRDDERDEMMEALALLDKRMREIRDTGKVSGTDRIAVMAALNIAHDLLRARRGVAMSEAVVRPREASESFDAEAARRKIQAMQATIDETLAGQEKLF